MSAAALILAFLSGAVAVVALQIAGLRSLLAPFEDLIAYVFGAG